MATSQEINHLTRSEPPALEELSKRLAIWILWVLAAILGMACRMVVAQLYDEAAFHTLYDLGLADNITLVASLIVGTAMATAQFAALATFRATKLTESTVSWFALLAWIPATAVGWAVGGFIDTLASPFAGTVASAFAIGAVVGACIGVAQWLILRWHAPRAGLWVPASILGMALADAVAAHTQAGSPLGVIVNLGMTGSRMMGMSAALGSVYGAITGVALVLLLSANRPHAPLPKANPLALIGVLLGAAGVLISPPVTWLLSTGRWSGLYEMYNNRAGLLPLTFILGLAGLTTAIISTRKREPHRGAAFAAIVASTLGLMTVLWPLMLTVLVGTW
jgi:hypothetical protein